jgi:hypothetical protein
VNSNNRRDRKDRKKPFNKISIFYNLFFIFTLVLLADQSAYAATYYVSTSGDDTKDGLTTSTAVKTIKQGLNKAQSSGDTVYVMTGTYSERNNISRSGIKLSAYPNNKPVIDGSALPGQNWSSLLSVTGSNNTVSGFEIRNSNLNKGSTGGMGIQVYGNNNTIEKINSHDTWSSGIFLSGDHNTVQDSSVWRTGLGGGSSGLSAARGSSVSSIPGITSYATIRRNKVFNNYGEALSCYEADHCIIEDNIIYDNDGVNLYLSDARNSTVQRNMIYISSSPAVKASNTGIALADERSSAPRSENNIIINNFLYKVNISAFNWTIVPYSGLNNVVIAYNTTINGGIYTKSPSSSVPIVDINSQITNNITIGTDPHSINNTSGISFSKNSWYGTIPMDGLTSTDVLGDPMVAKTGSTSPGALTPNFFKILDSSPVIGKAMPLDIAPEDFFRTIRGSKTDMGGHVSTATAQLTSTKTSTTPTTLTIYSTSTSNVTANSSTIKWSTSIPANGTLYYRINGTGTAHRVDVGKSTSQSVNITGLTANTTYEYDIWVWGDGQMIASPALYFTTTR